MVPKVAHRTLCGVPCLWKQPRPPALQRVVLVTTVGGISGLALCVRDCLWTETEPGKRRFRFLPATDDDSVVDNEPRALNEISAE